MDRNRKKQNFQIKSLKRHFVGPTGVLFVKPFYETLVALPCKNNLLSNFPIWRWILNFFRYDPNVWKTTYVQWICPMHSPFYTSPWHEYRK